MKNEGHDNNDKISDIDILIGLDNLENINDDQDNEIFSPKMCGQLYEGKYLGIDYKFIYDCASRGCDICEGEKSHPYPDFYKIYQENKHKIVKKELTEEDKIRNENYTKELERLRLLDSRRYRNYEENLCNEIPVRPLQEVLASQKNPKDGDWRKDTKCSCHTYQHFGESIEVKCALHAVD